MIGLVAVAAVAWVAGGGAWLVRNEVRFGSPVAPSGLRVMGVTIFAGETLADSASYYSVAGDLAATPGYPLRRKVAFFVRRWLGAGVQPVAALLLLLVVDLGVQRWRRSRAAGGNAPSSDDDPRLAMLVGGRRGRGGVPVADRQRPLVEPRLDAWLVAPLRAPDHRRRRLRDVPRPVPPLLAVARGRRSPPRLAASASRPSRA